MQRHLPVHGLRTAAFAAALTSASYAAECVPTPDSDDLLSIGALPIGGQRSLISGSAIESENCLEDSSRSYFDCEYQTENGVRYLVFGNAITRVETESNLVIANSILKGVEIGDSLFTVVSKLQAVLSNSPVWSIGVSTDPLGYVFGTDYCFVASTGAPYGYELSFDEQGVLRSVGIRSNW